MSEQNVETLRSCFALANDRGIDVATDAFSHLLDDEFTLEEAVEVPDSESYRGKEAFIANLRKLEEEFDELRIEPREFVDLGDRVVVVVSMAGRGRASGAAVEVTFAQLWSLRDGKAMSLRDFATKAEALEAVGLRESDER
jgi:ketosteroid isomerase-like protein